MTRQDYDRILARQQYLYKLAYGLPPAGGSAVGNTIVGGLGKILGGAKRLLVGNKQVSGPYAEALEAQAKKMGKEPRFSTLRPVGGPDPTKWTKEHWKTVPKETWEKLKSEGVFPKQHFTRSIGPTGETIYHTAKMRRGGLVGFGQKHPGIAFGVGLGVPLGVSQFSGDYGRNVQGAAPAEQVYYQQGSY